MWEGLGCCLHPELIHQLPLQSGQCVEDLAWSLSGTRSKCGRWLGCCLHPEQIHQLPLLSGQCIEDLAWSSSGTRSKCGGGAWVWFQPGTDPSTSSAEWPMH